MPEPGACARRLEAGEKQSEKRRRTCKPSRVPALAKFTRRGERRLLALIGAGATLAEAARAVEISRQALYDRTRTDVLFAERVRVARERRQSTALPVDPAELDWRAAARQLEIDAPERWAVAGGVGDPFDFAPFDVGDGA
jgi:hypothetical protein